MKLTLFIVTCTLIKQLMAIYVPELNQDWTLLRPELNPPKGSVISLPFNIGFVANSYVWDKEKGAMVEPEHQEATRLITTTVTKSYVTAAPQATTTIDLVQIDDGQIQRKTTGANDNGDCEEDDSDSESDYEGYVKRSVEADSPVFAVACSTNTALSLSLKDGILKDNQDRICSIVSGHQFQCDGPVPQYGTLFAAGWSVTPQGLLALGNSTKFYQCALGDFYNIYDTSIDPLCNPVVLNVVELIEC